MLLIRSLAFQVWMYGLLAILGVLLSPMALWSRTGAYRAIGIYLPLVFWGMRRMCGLTFEVRGTPPTGEALVAAKHQSFLDILILLDAMPAAKFVMKRSLVWAPIIGFYALRIGANPVTRGKGAESLAEMMAGVEKRRDKSGQLVIFPQGTRVPPGEKRPYKFGAYALYASTGLPATPVALDTGRFWPRIGVIRRPGVAVLEFLEPIPPGLDGEEFMARLEEAVETRSDALAREVR
jgi:1-acyl-sn-glycerol-3-phosphate acyltransferase